MNRPLRTRLTVALALLAGTFSAVGTPYADEAADPAPPDVDRWIEVLGSDSFVQRDFAGRQLLRAGTPAITALVQAARGENPVAARTAVQLLSRLACNDQGEMSTLAHQGLAELDAQSATLPPELGASLRQGLRAADRRVAGILRTLGGVAERDESATIVGLQVHDNRFADEHAPLLARLTRLKRLDLRETALSDDALVAIGSLTRLEELNLSDTAVTGEGLQRLSPLTSLTKLSIYRLPASPEQLQSLRAQHPDCEIRH